jgi:hypothetical protein
MGEVGRRTGNLQKAVAQVIEAVDYIVRVNDETYRRGFLPIWTVYDHPTDHPDTFIARRFENDKPTTDAIAGDLDLIRKCMQRAGLTCLMRAASDDAKIVETWL